MEAVYESYVHRQDLSMAATPWPRGGRLEKEIVQTHYLS